MDEKDNVMKYIWIRNNSYRVCLKNKYFKVSKSFKILDDAKKFRNLKLVEYENYIKNEYQNKVHSLETPSEETDMNCIWRKGFKWIVQIRNKDEPRIYNSFEKLEV
jgi:hypothetical protein